MRPVASGNQKGRQNEGQQTLSKKGYDATEVFELREYQPGDSIRTIHWKLSEKFDTVLVREPSDTSSYDILVMFDKPRGGLSVSPQLLKKVQGGYVYLAMWDVMNDYVLRSESIGLISYATTNGIYLVDNGVWMGEISGFIFGVYNSQEEDAAFIGYTDAFASIRLVKKTIEE